ncbi:unnamed protein product [Cuscuta campestris]|uniref:RecQ mediated genome instability protein 1 OB-fold domain-containing protein n=1 Tax=Cuscuta campestris TaxID=132261 RepID=A0A484K637_9ASTE|nr:unnamed protein product [Cuscuta campestris]
METCSSPATLEAVLPTLASRGWCFNDIDQVKSLISAESCSVTIDSVESELIKLDFRSIGGKTLPDPSSIRRVSHLQGPKVLQISSVRDISCSKMTESSGISKSRRLLRLKLTDGHHEVTAIEYSYISSIPEDVIPGTKVRLENKIAVRGGILCLNAKTVTVLGGFVESLYDEWQMNKKYSGLPRSSLRKLQEDASCGPPPFEKLQVGAYRKSKHHAQLKTGSESSMSSTKSPVLMPAVKDGSSTMHNDSRHDTLGDDKKQSNSEIDEATTSSEARPKEVAESFPVNNQAASQKLLQKMSQPFGDNRRTRGQRHRGKDKHEESHLLTLDEWERSKMGNFSGSQKLSSFSQDEDLARQLQEQFDLEDVHAQKDSGISEAETIRLSMFRFDREDSRPHGTMGFRGRGRARGRGRRGGGRRT